MKSTIETEQTTLGVSCEPIKIISLSTDGLLPLRLGEPHANLERPFHCQHLPPRNLTEKTLLSIWVNTHQAMFITTGISAFCVLKMCDLVDSDANRKDIRDWSNLATECRLAAAVYTNLPALTRAHYEAYVRESMKRVHDGFSGVSNRESICMEAALRSLKLCYKKLQIHDPGKAKYFRPLRKRISSADKTWWQHHGMAMSKLVESPVSLARIDFGKRKKAGCTSGSFADYRNTILREDSALLDYDDYFAVTRRDDLTLDDYRQLLKTALIRTEAYVKSSGVMEQYRANGTKAMFEVIDRIEAELSSL